MIEGALVEVVVTCLMILTEIRINPPLTGQMMLMVMDISHYIVIKSEIYKDLM